MIPPTDEAAADEIHEPSYIRGFRMGWASILRTALNELGYDDPEAQGKRYILEREAAITALRSACEHHGDNDWPADLHLADIIDKHLARHLDSRSR